MLEPEPEIWIPDPQPWLTLCERQKCPSICTHRWPCADQNSEKVMVALDQGFPNWGTCTPRGTFAYLKMYI